MVSQKEQSIPDGQNAMRVLIDCTHVFNHPTMNSGIQRVVRNIIRNLPERYNSSECIPVVYANDSFHRVLHLLPSDPASRSLPGRYLTWMQAVNNRLWERYFRLCKSCDGQIGRMRQASQLVLCHVFYRPLLFSHWIARVLGFDPFKSRTLPIHATEQDIIILLDAAWNVKGFREHIEMRKANGARISTCIYDTIPIKNRQFCTEDLTNVFASWLNWASRWSDSFVCISRSVRDEVKQEMISRLGKAEAGRRTYGYFHLGSELDLREADKTADERLQVVFSGEQPVFLAVGTIEPRKNHQYLLDVFDILWAQGSKARLCIVGRVGWKCDDFMERVNKHPELGKKLFMFNGLDDNGLEYAYANASALIFPSFAEGFGLPLVEAMQRGLPAIASDIPVFREVGGDYLSYCNPQDPETCAAIIREFERTGRLPGAKPLDDWKWITWKESTEQLLEAVTGAGK